MAMITPPVASDNFSTNRLKISMEPTIQLLDGNKFPTVWFAKKVKKVAIGNPTRRWLTDTYRPRTDQVNNGAGYSTSDTDITVDNGDRFRAGDVWRNVRTRESLLVDSVASDVVTFTRNYASAGSSEVGYVAAMVDDDWLELVGNVNLEGADTPGAMHTLEVERSNYTQILRDSFEMTNTLLACISNVDNTMSYEDAKHLYEHMENIDDTFLSEQKPRSIASSGSTKTVRLSGGAGWFLRNYGSSDRVISVTTWDEDTLWQWIQACYYYGSGKKVLMAPPLLHRFLLQTAMNKLMTVTTDKQFGMNITKIVHPFGNGEPLLLVNHKRLTGPVQNGTGTGAYGRAFIFDLEDLKYCYLKGRDTTLLTNRQGNGEDLKLYEYLTEACLQMSNFDFHGMAYGFTGFEV